MGQARGSSLSPHREISTEQPTHGWAPAAQTAKREMAPRMAPSHWEFGTKALKAETGAVWELEPAACRGMQSQIGEHCRDKPAFPLDPSSFTSFSFQSVSPHSLLPRAGQGSRCRRHSSSLSAYPDPAVPAPLQEGWSRGWRAISHWPRGGKAHLFRLFKFGTHRTYHSNALEAKGFGFFFLFLYRHTRKLYATPMYTLHKGNSFNQPLMKHGSF